MRGMVTGIALAALVATASADPIYTYMGGAATGTITISGGSTLRDWSCDVTEFDAAVESTGAVAVLPSGRERASFDIPVAGIDCRNRTMNNHMRNALRGDDHPMIRFDLDGVRVVGDAALVGTGRLTIGGRTTPITVDASYTRGDGTLRVQGEKPLVMTELGVRPPTLMLGTLKVHDRITIAFDLVIRQSAVTLAASGPAAGR